MGFRSLLRYLEGTSSGRRPNARRRAARNRPANRKFWVEMLEERALPTAWVTTDKPDYAPGETVLITGGDFGALETVQLQVLHNDGTPNDGEGHEPWQVTSDPTGDFVATWTVPYDDSRGSSFTLMATGLTSGEQAESWFTDSARVDLEAWRTTGTPGWQSNTLNPGSHTFSEGDSIPFRYVLKGVATGSTWSLTIQYDFANGARHFFDSLSTYNQTVTSVNPTAGHTVTSGPNSFAIPTDPAMPPGAQVPGSFVVYNGSITTAGPVCGS